MTTAFIIRFHYDEKDPRFAWRLAYFRSMVLPRILAQTGVPDDFEIAIRCNPVHDKIFRAMHPKIRVFHVNNERPQYKKNSDGKKYFFDFVPWEDVLDLPRYELQLGLDSDDLIAPNYLAKIHEYLKLVPALHLDRVLHVSAQPQLFDLKTLRIFPVRHNYSPTHGSAFFALLQPAGHEPYRFAYEISHLRMHKIADWSIAIKEEGLCYATAHHLNESTGVSDAAREKI